jgi:spore maturation protein CgeB
MLWSYYEVYLNYFYKKNPSIGNLSFEEHRQKIFDDHFGWPSELATYMNKNGYEVEFIIDNDELLQKKWAKENNLKDINQSMWKELIVLNQIYEFKPDLLLIPNPKIDTYVYIDGAKGDYKKLAFYLGHDLSNEKLIKQADILFTINKKYVYDRFPNIENLYHLGVAFPYEVLEKTRDVKVKYDVIFTGSISSQHTRRAEVLAYLVKNNIDLRIYGCVTRTNLIGKVRKVAGDIIKRKSFIKALESIKDIVIPSDSEFDRNAKILSKVCLSPVYGVDYYQCLASARICLNIHIDISTKFSGNIRMYESTGVGTCLLTDKKETNGDLFEVNKEIIEFDSKEGLLKILEDVKNNNYIEVDKIAERGQKKTLTKYSTDKMFSVIETALKSAM